MAAKSYNLDGIGSVTVYKRRGTRRMNLRLVGGLVRVTQPTWLPYAAGVQFANNNAAWIASQRQKQPELSLEEGVLIGKSHTLTYESDKSLRTRITDTKIIIYIPPHLNVGHELVLKAAKSAIKRALKKEAEAQLPDRLAYCAKEYNFNYKSVHCKSMRSRWGSCNNNKEITLNIFLMMLPWELIDYVLVHELTHTIHLHHGPEFWNDVQNIMPDFKERRKELKSIQHSITPLQ